MPAIGDALDPILARVYAARQVRDAHDLDYRLERLPTPTSLAGIEQAVDILVDAVTGARRIVVVADFDADGATSCALAVLALRAMGAGEVSYCVPNRFEYGYGLSPEIVDVVTALGADVVVTVDNGISSLQGVARARSAGMQVVITDHHLPGPELPLADAIVNPNQPGCPFPGKYLAGVGVIFYTMLALRAALRAAGWFGQRGPAEPNLANLLDLVALGTVADVVRLDEINRCLVAQGLARIQAGRGRPGIVALLEAGNRNPRSARAADLAFAAGPRLNAAGRLTDMSVGIECLLADDVDRATALATQLDELNRERRDIEATMSEQAQAGLDAAAAQYGAHALPHGLCLFDESWHQGVIGIVAARMRERWHRPVVAFAPSSPGEIKGSARSVPGVHIRDVFDAVAARHPGLLDKFGGHAMAAGVTLARDKLSAFESAFIEELERTVQPEDLVNVIWTDGELEPARLTLELADTLADAGPWGQGFPEPVFDGLFDVLDRRIVGERHVRAVLRPPGGNRGLGAIAFNALDWFPMDAPRIRCAYRLEPNEYSGTRSAQLAIVHAEPAPGRDAGATRGAESN